jgi:hypothetical protein
MKNDLDALTRKSFVGENSEWKQVGCTLVFGQNTRSILITGIVFKRPLHIGFLR